MLEVGFRILGMNDLVFSYFVYELDFHRSQLRQLLESCGLDGNGGMSVSALEDCQVGIDVINTDDASFPNKITQYIDPAQVDIKWVNGDVDDDLPF